MKALIVAVLAFSAPALADVITDLGVLGSEGGRAAHLVYVLDGATVNQARCPASGIFDRTTCVSDQRSAAANDVITQLLQFAPTNLEALASAVREQSIKIDRVDLRLDELLNTPSDDPNIRRLESDLAANQTAAASLEAQRTDRREQVAEIRARLAQPNPDADLARQLSVLEAEILDDTRRLEALASARNVLVVQLIHARAIPGNTEVDELSRWREELVVAWEARQANYLEAISRAATYHALVRHLTKSQNLFALELLTTNTLFQELRPAAAVLDAAFEKALAIHGRSPAANWYVLFGKGDFQDASGAFFTITGWSGGSQLFVTRIPDLKQQCFDSVEAPDLDYSRFLAAPLTLGECYVSGRSHVCRERREHASPAGNRFYVRDLSLSFRDDGDVDLEMWTWCYMADGRNTIWEENTYRVWPAVRQQR